jgi:pimeloyl-ACP methyl ester carboxylesterase
MRRAIIAVGVLVALSIVLLLAAGVILGEGALRVPRHHNQVLDAVSGVRSVQIVARDGIHLNRWIVSPLPPARDCVVVLHGIADSRSSMAGFARLFTANNYTVLLPDSRGHGDSEGAIVTYGVLEADDVHRWVDLLISSEGCRHVLGLGESLGAGILLQSLSIEPRFRAVVAESPFASLERIGQARVAERLPLPPVLGRPMALPIVLSGFLYARLRYGIDLFDASPETAVRRSTIPILLIHGLKDTRTSAENSRILAASNPRIVLWLVPDAGHTNASVVEPVEFRKRVLEWFRVHG